MFILSYLAMLSSVTLTFDTCEQRRVAYGITGCCGTSDQQVPDWANHTCTITNYYESIDKSIAAWYVFDELGRTYHLQFTFPFSGNAITTPQLTLDAMAAQGTSLERENAAWRGYRVYPVSAREFVGTWETDDDHSVQNLAPVVDGYINFGVKFNDDMSGFDYPFGAPMLRSPNMMIVSLLGELYPPGMYSDVTVFQTNHSYAIRDPFAFATQQTRVCDKH